MDCTAPDGPPLILSEDSSNRVRYSYRVTWSVCVPRQLCIYLPNISQESETPWATRWDNYLHIFDPVGCVVLLT